MIWIDCRKLGHYGIGNVLEAILVAVSNSEQDVALLGYPDQMQHLAPKFKRIEFKKSSNNPFAYFFLKNLVEKYKPELVIAPHYVGVSRLPTQILLYIHDFIHIKFAKSGMDVFFKALIKRAINSSNLVVCPSNYTKIEARKFGINSENWIVIPPPVKPIFRNLELKSKEDFYLAVFSNLKKHKGVNNLIQIWEKNFPKLVIAGNVGSLRYLKKNNIDIVPNPSDIDLIDLYQRARWILIPSFDEGFGYVYLESRFAYTPVISRPLAPFVPFKTEIDIFSEDLSDDALQSAIKASFKRGDEVNINSFKAIQSEFDGTSFNYNFGNVINQFLYAEYRP